MLELCRFSLGSFFGIIKMPIIFIQNLACDYNGCKEAHTILRYV